MKTRYEAIYEALSILEAAGIDAGDYEPGEMRDLDHVAVDALRRWKKEQDAKSARETEDAKVREYLNAAKGTNSYDHYRITDYDRAEYKRVQKLFQEEQ